MIPPFSPRACAGFALLLLGACADRQTSLRTPAQATVSPPASPPAPVPPASAPPAAEPTRTDPTASTSVAVAPDSTSPDSDEDAASPCTTGPAPPFEEPDGPRKSFSIHGYVAHDLRIERMVAGTLRVHCLRIGWPSGDMNNEGQPSTVAAHIGPSWFRAIENTLARVPWHHVRTLERVIIDNRPKEHGIAPYDRQSPDDARDGHTMWLHEHLFRDPNHWAHGNHGSYWSYHVNEDGKTFAALPPDHDAFSPVLLHELGHIVMYNVVNGGSAMPSTPPCARTCGDMGDCSQISQLEREAGCISPYCMPFRYPAGTENFAEQYRFHYQSAATRELLSRHRAGCAELLAEQDALEGEPHPPPWQVGLPESAFRPSLWKSCQGRACKGF